MDTDYTCWRITREPLKTIEICPKGSLDVCMGLVEGDICPKGMKVKL